MRKRRKEGGLLLVLAAAVFIYYHYYYYILNIERDTEREIERSSIEMGVKKLDATVSTLDDVLKSEATNNKDKATLIILFLADIDPSTSLSWCPDCVRAEPVIYKKLEASSGDVVLLRAYVGDRPTWRNPLHPWRVDSRFKLTGVPTLIRWENEAINGRLEDHEAHVEKKIDALLA